MRVLCASHGHCFDGLCSSVLFLRAQRRGALGLDPSDELEYLSAGYSPGQPRPDTNAADYGKLAILDYRYSPLSNLTHYFDHHRTAFANSADRADFEKRRAARPACFVFDDRVSSCTKLIADHLRNEAGIALNDLDDLIVWADTVDAARFESPHAASDHDNPILRLVSVVEQFGSSKFLSEAVPILESGALVDFANSSLVSERYSSIAPHHQQFLRLVAARGTQRGRVAFVDMSSDVVQAVSKFAVYAAFPGALYSVVIARLRSTLRISAGYNPWCGAERDRDIGSMCAEHGGGGHPVVGGIAFRLDELERAQAVASDLAQRLELTEVA